MIIGKQEKECVVYRVTNLINGKEYIGVSTNFIRRMTEHKRIPPVKMIIDIKYYDNFDKEIIFQGNKEECFNKEIELIAKEKPYYNSSPGGEGGNGLFGEDIWNSKLTKEEVMEIRFLYKYVDDYTQQYIGDLYSISREGIRDIVLGKIWKEAGGPISIASEDFFGENNPMSKLTDETIKIIRIRARDTDDLLTDIGKDYPQVSEKNISRIVKGDRWKNAPGPIEGKDYIKNRKTGPKAGQRRKLTEEQVIELRIRGRDTKDSYVKISNDYPVSNTLISQIIRNVSNAYKNLPGPILGKDYKKRGQGSE